LYGFQNGWDGTNLIELGSHIKVVDGRLTSINAIQADERIDLKISKVEVCVNAV